MSVVGGGTIYDSLDLLEKSFLLVKPHESLISTLT
jgi:hypothetical protein